jgi:hypothetical protein
MIYELALEQLSVDMFRPGIVTRLKQLSEGRKKKHEGSSKSVKGGRNPLQKVILICSLFAPIFSLNPNGWPKLASSINRPTPRPPVLDKKTHKS